MGNLENIHIPVLLSIVGIHSSYNHVIVVWRNQIFDLENEHPYNLTVQDIHSIAGKTNPFRQLVCGCFIYPSKAMKIENDDQSDWGEREL